MRSKYYNIIILSSIFCCIFCCLSFKDEKHPLGYFQTIMRIQAKYQGIRKIAFFVFPSCQFSGFKLISAMSGVKLLIELPEEEVSFVYCGPLRPHAGQIPAPPLYFLQAQAQVPGSHHHPFFSFWLLIGTAHFLMEKTSSLVFP